MLVLMMLVRRRARTKIQELIPDILEVPDLKDLAVRARIQMLLRFRRWKEIRKIIQTHSSNMLI